LELEIGFGNGEYLARRAELHPERDFVGLEIAWNSHKRALRRLAEPPKKTNVRLLHLPAFPALKLFFEPNSLSNVKCLFPVPWPNERHAQKRLFSAKFLDLLANRLKSDATFTIVTDHEGLALWAMDRARESTMDLKLFESDDLKLDTKYERKWLSTGQKIFYHLTGRKIAHAELGREDFDQMRSTISYLINPSDYHPQGRGEEPTIVFGDLIYDYQKKQGLLSTKVVEDQFVQKFFIKISQQPDGSHKLAPAFTSQVYPTYGVALALELAALREPKTLGQIGPDPAKREIPWDEA
jgi:tRNA (guanine-N7-)-methyltransferase